ncbi:MAG: hypothetical protein GC159_05365 [Phycisphaera sp.]|nr:hypothetical protein [Phycisphaera sp.]
MNDQMLQAEDRFDDLLRGLLDGTITPDEHAELEVRLTEDPAARRRYQDHMMLHALLRWDQTDVSSRPIALEPPRAIELDQAGKPIAPTAPRHDQADEVDDVQVVGRISPWRRAAMAAVVILGVGLSIAMIVPRSGSNDDPANNVAPGVAMLTDASAATWAEDSVIHEASAVGDQVPDGPIRLKSGSAQMVLASGAAVTLQGPTEMRVTGNNRSELTRGRLTVNVPVQAHGMAVTAPGGISVVDLGTRFSMAVDEWGRVEVYVLEGTVEVNTSPANTEPRKLRLTAGQAVSVIEDRVTPIAITNVALGKQAGQSSQYNNGEGMSANSAVDGNPNTISHTAIQKLSSAQLATWQVDLGKTHTVRSVVLHNRIGCCAERLRDITVEVLAEDGKTVVYRSELLNPENRLNSPEKIAVVPVDDLGGIVAGRFVRVIRTPDPDLSGQPKSTQPEADATVLSIGEVEVFGYAQQATP